MLAGHVGCMVVGFPCHPHFVGSWEGFPFISGAGEMVRGKDSGRGNGKELGIGHGQVDLRELALGILEHFDVLRDAVRGCVVTDHLCWEMNQFAGMEATAGGIKMGEEFSG